MLSVHIGVDAPIFSTLHTIEMPISVYLMIFNGTTAIEPEGEVFRNHYTYYYRSGEKKWNRSIQCSYGSNRLMSSCKVISIKININFWNILVQLLIYSFHSGTKRPSWSCKWNGIMIENRKIHRNNTFTIQNTPWAKLGKLNRFTLIHTPAPKCHHRWAVTSNTKYKRTENVQHYM